MTHFICPICYELTEETEEQHITNTEWGTCLPHQAMLDLGAIGLVSVSPVDRAPTGEYIVIPERIFIQLADGQEPASSVLQMDEPTFLTFEEKLRKLIHDS